MKQSVRLPLARLASSLSLFGILLFIHMSFGLAYFLPSESKGVMDAVYTFFFVGNVLGAILCPLFLSVPGGKEKPPLMGICFIAFLVAVDFIIRSLGIRVWLGSVTARSIMTLADGILNPLCYGLFYLTWLRRPVSANVRVNRSGRFCSLVFGAALLGSVLVRYYSVPLLEAGRAAADPLKGVVFIFNFIKWWSLALGASACVNVFLIRSTAAASPPTGEDVSVRPLVKTNWSMILRLLGLASVFTILNGVIDMRMLPLYSFSNEALYYPHYVTVALAVCVLGFLAGRSIARFIRWFTPPAIILFILMPCLPLFVNHSLFNMIMGTLVAIAYYTGWVVFSTAVVEHFSGGFWFYGMTTLVFFSVVFAFLAPLIGPFVPDGTEYRVLCIALAAVSFMLLAFRLIFSAQPREPQPAKLAAQKPPEPFPLTSAMEDIFKERGLSQREIEVAALLVKEGLGRKEIGERLYIAEGTVKVHISKIYQKFDVNNQREFMALFVSKEE